MANWKPPPTSHNPPLPEQVQGGYASVNEFAALRAPLAQAASAGVCVAGALAIFSGLQLFMGRRYGIVYLSAPYVLLAIGFASLVSGWRVFRRTSMARLMLATVCSGLLTPLSGIWLLLGLRAGFISMVFGPFTPAAALVGFILCLVAIPSAQRADALRTEMKARGEDLGL